MRRVASFSVAFGLALTKAASGDECLVEGGCQRYSSSADGALANDGLQEDVAMMQTLRARQPSQEDPQQDRRVHTSGLLRKKPEHAGRRIALVGAGGASQASPSEPDMSDADGDSPCAIARYQAKYLLPSTSDADGFLPPMEVGHDLNMDPRLWVLGLDFSGLWWLRGNSMPQEVVSFANTEVDNDVFPVKMTLFSNLRGGRAWTASSSGEVSVAYYSSRRPNEKVTFEFEDSTSGVIHSPMSEVPLAWADEVPFKRLNDDEWFRPSIFEKDSMIPSSNYTMTRIVMADGTPHPTFWTLFMESMTSVPWYGKGRPGEKELISYSTDNWCMRKCMVAMPCMACRPLCAS